MGRISFSGDDKSIDEIWNWYQDQEEALNDYENKINSLISSSNIGSYTKFIGFSLSDLNDYFLESKRELDRLVCFNLISATEAALRIDFLKRVYNKGKDDLSRKFRDIEKESGSKISLETDIIDVWKDHFPTDKSKLSDFVGLLNYRHWLAHGRYWTPKLGQNYNAVTSYDITEKIFEVLNK